MTSAEHSDRRRIADIAQRCARSGRPPIDVVVDTAELAFMRQNSAAIWDQIAELRNRPEARKTVVDVVGADRTTITIEDDPSDDPADPTTDPDDDVDDEDDGDEDSPPVSDIADADVQDDCED